MGRPTLPKAELRRHRVNVMLTDDEFRRLKKWSTESDQPVGILAREVVLRALHRREP